MIYSFHREENIDNLNNLKKISESINHLAKVKKIKILVSTHPRTKKQLKKLKKFKFHKLVNFHKPFGFFDYITLQKNAYCTVSDSGTITEESSILNFPALNIREAQERHEGVEESTVMMVDLDIKKIRTALKILKTQTENKERIINIVNDYNLINVSEKVLRIIHSHTDYINKKVWKKY